MTSSANDYDSSRIKLPSFIFFNTKFKIKHSESLYLPRRHDSQPHISCKTLQSLDSCVFMQLIVIV